VNVVETAIEGLVILEPKVFADARGYFLESYNERGFQAAGVGARFVQDNESCSSYGVVRGLHFQRGEHAQAKLVRVIAGCVLDVVVDIREGSPTFGRHVAVELSGENKRLVFVPRGLAHGFAVLSETVVFSYKCDNFYNKGSEGGIAYDDPDLGIDWRVPADKIILSEKDKALPRLRDLGKVL